MPIISPTAISPHRIGGKSWRTYWTQQIQPTFDKMYYWWDNAARGDVRYIKIVHTWADGLHGTQYWIQNNSDALFEIAETHIVNLVNRKFGTFKASILTAGQGIGVRVENVNFSGTSIKYRVNTANNMGIFRAVLLSGTHSFRGQITLGAQGAVNAEKQNGYFYMIWQNGDYTTIDAGLTGCVVGDIISLDGGVWSKTTVANQTYIDVDCYSASGAVIEPTLFGNLTLGNYTLGIVALGTKNESSSGTNCYPVTTGYILTRSFAIYGGPPNAAEIVTTVQNSNLAHFTMSTAIKKNGTAQTAQWIPAHSGVNTLTYHSGETMQNWVDDTELTGYNAADQEFIEISEYTLQCVMYAINTSSAAEKLLKVTYDLVATITGWQCDIEYETLIETLATVGYSYMVPWYTSIFNRFVSDYREEITLPTDATNVNITDGAARAKMLVYNDTADGDYENYITHFEILNPAITNNGSAANFYLYKYGATWGKLYAVAVSNEVWPVGNKWNTSIKFATGYVSDLINKIAALPKI